MNVFEMEKEFNNLIKHGQELIEKLKQEKEPVKEADENDIGKLCWFWDTSVENKKFSILTKIDCAPCPYHTYNSCYDHCRRLTPAEVAEITGYKVEG